MFPTTCTMTASLSEPAKVGDRHTMPARSPSVGGIISRAIGLQEIIFATLGVSSAGRLGPNSYHSSLKITNISEKWKSLSHVQLCNCMDSTINRILWARNTGVCSLSLLHRISATQVLNPSLLHRRQFLYQLRHKGSKVINTCLDQISIPLLWNIWSVASYQFVLKPLTNFYNQDPAPL